MQPGNHQRTHAPTCAPSLLLLSPVTFYSICYLGRHLSILSSHFIGPASNQPAQSERTLLEPACMDHGPWTMDSTGTTNGHALCARVASCQTSQPGLIALAVGDRV